MVTKRQRQRRRKRTEPERESMGAPGGIEVYDNSLKSTKRRLAWAEFNRTGNWQVLVDAGIMAD